MTRLRIGLLALLALAPSAGAVQTLQGIEKPARVTLSGTTWNELTLPGGSDYVVFRAETTEAYFMRGCTDGAALGSHYRTLTADTDYTISIGSIRDDNVCIAGTASAVVQVTPMQRGK